MFFFGVACIHCLITLSKANSFLFLKISNANRLETYHAAQTDHGLLFILHLPAIYSCRGTIFILLLSPLFIKIFPPPRPEECIRVVKYYSEPYWV